MCERERECKRKRSIGKKRRERIRERARENTYTNRIEGEVSVEKLERRGSEKDRKKK